MEESFDKKLTRKWTISHAKVLHIIDWWVLLESAVVNSLIIKIIQNIICYYKIMASLHLLVVVVTEHTNEMK